jgi:NAD+ diphosphatase
MTMSSDFLPSVLSSDPQASDALWFVYSGYRLLVKISGNAVAVPDSREINALGVSLQHPLHLGSFRGRSCYAAAVSAPGGSLSEAAFLELRSLFERLERGIYEVALFGVHLLEWDKNSRYCGRCGGELKSRSDIRAKECGKCSRLEFPRISPAIIVLVEKENALLLARSSRFPGAFFSVLAGFVEPGESLEEAVRREVKEETGILVKDIAYFGSQPWPFPDSLMIGFTATYASGDIRIDGEEIVEAGWYRSDNLPQIPGKLSIARQLIDWFLCKHA